MTQYQLLQQAYTTIRNVRNDQPGGNVRSRLTNALRELNDALNDLSQLPLDYSTPARAPATQTAIAADHH